ncbi:MAG: RNA polymerase sigma factor, partial [Gammaproteobacteria bacterium]
MDQLSVSALRSKPQGSRPESRPIPMDRRCAMAMNKLSFLETLFRRHAGELRSFAHRRVGRQAAQDLVQEVFVR